LPLRAFSLGRPHIDDCSISPTGACNFVRRCRLCQYLCQQVCVILLGHLPLRSFTRAYGGSRHVFHSIHESHYRHLSLGKQQIVDYGIFANQCMQFCLVFCNYRLRHSRHRAWDLPSLSGFGISLIAASCRSVHVILLGPLPSLALPLPTSCLGISIFLLCHFFNQCILLRLVLCHY
jgi:hypothetical protein